MSRTGLAKTLADGLAVALPGGRVGVRQHPENVSVERGSGPEVVPQEVLEWKLVYDPVGNCGKGTAAATLGGESVTLALRDGDKAKGAVLDRLEMIRTPVRAALEKPQNEAWCRSRRGRGPRRRRW